MESLMTNLQENGKRILTATLDFANTTAESLFSVVGQTAKSAAAKAREFYEDNRQLVMIAAGVVAAAGAACLVLKLVLRKKK